MAELMLKIGNGSHYEDGDILCAFNDRRIQLVHAEHICHVKRAGTQNGSRLRPNDSLARMFLERTRQYRFERFSRAEVKRVTIATGEEATFGPTANASGQYIHVQEHVDRMLRHPGHAVFGEPGRETWYGGRTVATVDVADAIWSEIEKRTGYGRADCKHWPAGPQELKSHLFLCVDDFPDEAGRELVSPLLDQAGREKRRKHCVNWRGLEELSGLAASIEDKSQSVNLRGQYRFLRARIVRVKNPEAN